MIHILDRLEGYNPKARKGDWVGYERRKAKVFTPEGKGIWVSYYHWTREVREELKIPSGNWGKASR
jgi:gamma-glutamylcyclotransferase (GGCT)/AIG2-like uncharacterized protein YtfP